MHWHTVICGGINNGISKFNGVYTVTPLSDSAIKNVKPNPDNAFKIPDEKGMYLLVNQNGSKYFRLDYRFDRKRKTFALGVYPETTLGDAETKRD